jgi:hypothetical protein
VDTTPHATVRTLTLWIHRPYVAWGISHYESPTHTLRETPGTFALWIHYPYATENQSQFTGNPSPRITQMELLPRARQTC